MKPSQQSDVASCCRYFFIFLFIFLFWVWVDQNWVSSRAEHRRGQVFNGLLHSSVLSANWSQTETRSAAPGLPLLVLLCLPVKVKAITGQTRSCTRFCFSKMKSSIGKKKKAVTMAVDNLHFSTWSAFTCKTENSRKSVVKNQKTVHLWWTFFLSLFLTWRADLFFPQLCTHLQPELN